MSNQTNATFESSDIFKVELVLLHNPSMISINSPLDYPQINIQAK